MKAKKLVSLVVMLLGLIVFLPNVSAQESEDVYRDAFRNELTGQAMYEELSEQYPENPVFRMMLRSKDNHVRGLAYEMDMENMNYNDVQADSYSLPDSEKDALEFVLDHESQAIEAYEDRLEGTEDYAAQSVFGHLLNCSERHYDLLSEAVVIYERDGDLNRMNMPAWEDRMFCCMDDDWSGFGPGYNRMPRGHMNNRGHRRHKNRFFQDEEYNDGWMPRQRWNR